MHASVRAHLSVRLYGQWELPVADKNEQQC